MGLKFVRLTRHKKLDTNWRRLAAAYLPGNGQVKWAQPATVTLATIFL